MMKGKIESGLANKGFGKTDNGHRRFVYRSLSGKKTEVKTMTSHGSDCMISDGLVSKMARQCRLTTHEFERLVNCPMLRAEYENLLRAQGVSLD